jgi:hypothetical protein
VVQGPRVDLEEAARVSPVAATNGSAKASFAAGAAVMLALVAILRRKKN